jgi:hypothetical protein
MENVMAPGLHVRDECCATKFFFNTRQLGADLLEHFFWMEPLSNGEILPTPHRNAFCQFHQKVYQAGNVAATSPAAK